MAKRDREKSRKRKNNNSDEESTFPISIEALRGVFAVLAIAVALFLALAAFKVGGAVGSFIYTNLTLLLGVGYMLLPFSLLLLAIALMRSFEKRFGAMEIVSVLVFLLAGLGMVALILPERGGIVGAAIVRPLIAAVDTTATVIFLLSFLVAALIIAFDVHLGALLHSLRESLRARKEALAGDMREPEVAMTGLHGSEIEEEPEEIYEEPEEMPANAEAPRIQIAEMNQDAGDGFPIIAATGSVYSLPPLSLLGKNKGKPEVGDVKANMNIVKRTLQNFGIQVEMDEVSIGPTVTRYAMKPAEGVRLAKIVALQSNLELALAASPVRIEAPIPGKSLVGIEVPNISRTTLGLAPLFADNEFTQSSKSLLIGLGRSITGAAHFADLARMPHLLVAGTTGAGKTCGKDTYVFSEKGILTFEELCPLPLNTEIDYSLRIATRDGVETTSKNYNNGICDFYKITTEEGLSIEVTAEHPLWVMRDGAMCWQNGGSMRAGEYVAISRGSKLFGVSDEIRFSPTPHTTNKTRVIKTPTTMTKELGLFLGLLTADGGLTVHNRVVYTQANAEVLGTYTALLKDLFHITAPIVAKSGQSNKAKDVIVNSKHLKDFLTCLGVKPVGAREKEIPRSIRESSSEVIKAFIQGLIRNDGHVSATRGLEITLANERLIKQLQIILLNFGIVSSVHAKKVKNYEERSYSRLSIYGAEFATYAQEIGFLTTDEENRANQALARQRNTNRDIVPTLAPILKKLSLSYRAAFARLTNTGWHYQSNALVPKYAFKSLPSYASGVRSPSYGALERILTFYEPLSNSSDFQTVAKIREDNFYWAKVATIEKTVGEGYDFEVPGSHSFVGNGFINHNSVAIHDFIVSLLYRAGPEKLRFIMVDPKRVELTMYNSIPHLLTPVITDAKKCILALKWLAKEMERRYNVLETERVRDIHSYHENIVAPAIAKADTDKPASTRDGEQTRGGPMPEAMPYIVLIIDELADIMSAYPRELEAGIVRLAQMSRAVGIHLILSTQRPSVKVITGLIKANIPARVAFQVASQIDSRTILDMSGAEKLLGAGDMLFLSSDMSKPRRIQTPYISETEVKRVVSYIVRNNAAGPLDGVDFSEAKQNDMSAILDSMADEDGDEKYVEAKQAVLEAGKASTSYLQRKLGIGYSRAAKLIDMLEERGVIGPSDGSKPREVIGAGNADELVASAEGSEETDEFNERV
ncbi:hypothetical protein A3A38_02285 [Candidatus Kaiserbacteria bacterium RIFCSPLOWO2_01_FULL_53_17]|uniref:FtsK domain-containing protein n=1 Tax=Candidatus Kaiserbacteria bacterium RIFCSPLOWO2_01_FULL_53_17 TaxID=1798511 RepID=A0A1F6EFX1_9BACT|nr:MAG: hypothetical protein A3A38_02285 [Candidatus Kaiserbacteria bacterium RIFCSPLOWO2_01_FULL_53_17]